MNNKANEIAKLIRRRPHWLTHADDVVLKTISGLAHSLGAGELKPDGWDDYPKPFIDDLKLLHAHHPHELPPTIGDDYNLIIMLSGISHRLGGYEGLVGMLNKVRSMNFGWAVFGTGRLGGNPPYETLVDYEVLADGEATHSIDSTNRKILELLGIETIKPGELTIVEKRSAKLERQSNCKITVSDMEAYLNDKQIWRGSAAVKEHHLALDEIVHALAKCDFNPNNNGGEAGWLPLITDWQRFESVEILPRRSMGRGTKDHPTEILLWVNSNENS